MPGPHVTAREFRAALKCIADPWPPSRAASGSQLVRGDRDVEQVAVAEHAEAEPAADGVGRHHQALQVPGVLHGNAVDLEDEVLAPQAGARGRAAGHDLDDLDAGVAPDGAG